MGLATEQSTIWICETAKTPFEILAGLRREGINISYQNLMNIIGVLVAEHKLRRIKRMDKKYVYEMIQQIKETKSEDKKK